MARKKLSAEAASHIRRAQHFLGNLNVLYPAVESHKQGERLERLTPTEAIAEAKYLLGKRIPRLARADRDTRLAEAEGCLHYARGLLVGCGELSASQVDWVQNCEPGELVGAMMADEMLTHLTKLSVA